MKRRAFRLMLALCALVMLRMVAQPAAAQDFYFLTDLGTLPGGYESHAFAVNNKGQIAGTSNSSSGYNQAFLYTNGKMIGLGTLGGLVSLAFGINNKGEVVGQSSTSNNTVNGFLYDGKSLIDLGYFQPGGLSYSSAYGINDAGLAVGVMYPNGLQYARGFLYWNRVMFTLGPLSGANDSNAYGINNKGQIVGESNGSVVLWNTSNLQVPAVDLGTLAGTTGSEPFAINDSGQVVGDSGWQDGHTHAFLGSVSDGMTDLGTLGGKSSFALGINNNGQVVGWSWITDNSDVHAFLWQNGTMVDINNLISPFAGWDLGVAYGINDLGQIVGTGTTPTGLTHAFLLTPVYVITVPIKPILSLPSGPPLHSPGIPR
jgi:probable HAF family extracellular repeat protein